MVVGKENGVAVRCPAAPNNPLQPGDVQAEPVTAGVLSGLVSETELLIALDCDGSLGQVLELDGGTGLS